ncbi:MAG: hypothetical protein COY75_02025 [Nitrospirae bacterium CG_4_10_14_0_8_um_filter_41_23]|nr:nucleotidyl transferase AbiEii/AbiGii toxin family protein [Nitrospirota bacterium]OIP59480.1 MAG: hypothetical protein AUK38_05555 [Nitrospirae bacterium CG2_30_41_42]PIQ93545.1 MAG: hypothetical protein COV68_09485 [Nitrospirae bacterium CG11_big_fil_rev_8_21_14_0_20_41_14]PIV44733.1 MAG: hypothetical protein COS27_00820 [Nitrospirae bacterium CG02_land_8_20_14_3_00_41_53]PIW88074.1 MAG: hypothetical protein COZ94_01690 [Nitrospirae bacterium CG_4_8_14_3_um_filter_41_47]PIY87598.1 MAG: hy
MHRKTPDEGFLKICNAFNRRGVEYIVIGGFAMIMHGLPRTTVDIDFFINGSPDNMEKIKDSLKEVFNDEEIEGISPSDVSEYSVIRYGTPDGFYIDLIGKLGEAFKFDDFKSHIETFEINHIDIPVCDVEMLIKMKQTVRTKDITDIEFLQEKLRQKKGIDY